MSQLPHEAAALLADLEALWVKLQNEDPVACLIIAKNIEASATKAAHTAKDSLLETGGDKWEWGGYDIRKKRGPGRWDFKEVAMVRQTEERLKYLKDVATTIVEPMADTLTGEEITPAVYYPGKPLIEIRKNNG